MKEYAVKERKGTKSEPDNKLFLEVHKFDEALKLAKQYNGSKKFNQTIDVCVTVKQMDFKKQENKIKETIYLKNSGGLKKIVFAIGKNLCVSAKGTADKVFNEEQYAQLEKDKKKIKKFSKSYDYLLAEPDYMLRIAKSMGRILGPLGKMPMPIVPTADPKPIIEKLKNSIMLMSTQNQAVQFTIGKEKEEDSVLKENYYAVINVLKNKFPHGVQNVKNIYLKTSMGKKIRVDTKI